MVGSGDGGRLGSGVGGGSVGRLVGPAVGLTVGLTVGLGVGSGRVHVTDGSLVFVGSFESSGIVSSPTGSVPAGVNAWAASARIWLRRHQDGAAQVVPGAVHERVLDDRPVHVVALEPGRLAGISADDLRIDARLDQPAHRVDEPRGIVREAAIDDPIAGRHDDLALAARRG